MGVLWQGDKLDPETIVLGGMIASSGDIMLEAIRTETTRRLLPQQAEQVSVVLSTLGDLPIDVQPKLTQRHLHDFGQRLIVQAADGR